MRSFSILTVLWEASTAARSIKNALNAAYDVEESRPASKLNSLSLISTIGRADLLIAATGLMLPEPDVMQRLAG